MRKPKRLKYPNETKEERKARHREKVRQYRQTYRKRNIENGVCPNDGRNLASVLYMQDEEVVHVAKLTVCFKCIKKMNKYQSRKRKRRKNATAKTK